MTGAVYDTGDYAKSLDTALELVGYEELRAEQRDRRRDPAAPLLGIGIGCYVETSGNGAEFGAVSVEDDGTVVVTSGSVPHGQGHETMWAQIASATLGVSLESVRVVHSDTSRVDHGTGTFGSRSLQLAGSAVLRASEQVLIQARDVGGRSARGRTRRRGRVRRRAYRRCGCAHVRSDVGRAGGHRA